MYFNTRLFLKTVLFLSFFGCNKDEKTEHITKLTFHNQSIADVAFDSSKSKAAGVSFASGTAFTIVIADTDTFRKSINSVDLLVTGHYDDKNGFFIYHYSKPILDYVYITPPPCIGCWRGREFGIHSSKSNAAKLNIGNLSELNSVRAFEFGNGQVRLFAGDIYVVRTREQKIAVFQLKDVRAFDQLIEATIEWRNDIEERNTTTKGIPIDLSEFIVTPDGSCYFH